jgi:hypothetical protein
VITSVKTPGGVVIGVVPVPLDPTKPLGPTKPGYVKPGTNLPLDPTTGKALAGAEQPEILVTPGISYLSREVQKLSAEAPDLEIEFVNDEDIVVSRNGTPKVSLHVRAIDGSPVYYKRDGSFTTDIHGGRLPSGVVLMNDRGIVVDERGHPSDSLQQSQ